MNRFLQITFVPHIENGWNFFVWLTDHEGGALPFPGSDADPEPVPRWLGEQTPYHFFITSASFAVDRRRVPVVGAVMTMESVFRLMRDDRLPDTQDALYPGETFRWFSRIADVIQILLENAHFYPFIYHLKSRVSDRSYYCSWMPDARLVTDCQIFADWLTHLPPLALAIEDLQDVKVRQWLYLIVIFWTDCLVRKYAGMDYPLAAWPGFVRRSEADHSRPFQQLLEESNPFDSPDRPWIVTHNPEESEKMDALVREVTDWIRPVAGSQLSTWANALIDYRRVLRDSVFSPERIRIVLSPLHDHEPFSPGAIWCYHTIILGWQNGRKTEQLLDEFRYPQSLNDSTWLDDRLNALRGELPDRLLDLFRERGYGRLTLDDLSELFHCRRKMSAASVDLIFPETVRIIEPEDRLTVDLDVSRDSDSGGSLFSLEALVSYNWRIAIGNIPLSAAEFKQLVKENRPFIRREGAWIHLPMEQMRKACLEMNDMLEQIDRRRDVAGALRLRAGRRQSGKKTIRVHYDASLDRYLRQLINKTTGAIPLPARFLGSLRPYQEKGYTWLVSLRKKGVGGCLADDMGLGKTVQTIAYLCYNCGRSSKQTPENTIPVGPALIVCPTSLVANWKHEFRRFAPELSVYIHHGGKRLGGASLADRLKQSDVMITSYTIFTRESDQLKKIYWDSVILDEAQAIKNPRAQKTRALRSVHGAHRLVLTGTPIENRLEELWSLFDFINPGYLGPLDRFRKQFIWPIEKKNDQKRAEQLTKMIRPFLLRREKSDRKVIRDLPDKLETRETCYLNKSQASLYQSFVDRLAKNVTGADGFRRKGLILSTLTKLKQVCDHPALIRGESESDHASGKLDLFFQILDPLFTQNEKVLVFTQYVQMGALLVKEVSERYPDADVFFLHGGLNGEQRDRLINRFRNIVNRKTLFVLSLKAGGVGLNLTEANYVIHYDRWWNPAVEEQATDRAYRIGQHRNVHVYKLICAGTLEERIDQLIERKKGLQHEILGRGEAWLTELDDKEIYELIKLREEVI